MAGYTTVNLKEVEDPAPKFGYAPNLLEARFARVLLELENSGISYFRLAPNFRVPFGHKHRQQEEVSCSWAAALGRSSTTRWSS